MRLPTSAHKEVITTAMILPPISADDLTGIALSFPTRFPFIRPTPEAIQFNMAATVLRAILGDEWSARNLVASKSTDSHLSPSGTDTFGRMKVQSRIVALAELIFNLQSIPNAPGRFERLREIGLETAVAELEAGRLLALNGIPFGFVAETGERQSDYDIEVRLMSGRALCCETKCKLSRTSLSSGSILNSLKKASQQLPSDKPGLIFIKYPESWIAVSSVEEIHRKAITRFFRSSGRVVGVVVHWEEWHPQQNGRLLRLAKYREVPNKSSRFASPELTGLFRPWSPLWLPREWKGFRELLGLPQAG